MIPNKVSVIIPNYNRIVGLKRAVDSVISQSYKNWEIIVVDDHSDNPPVELVEGYQDQNIRLIQLNEKTNAAHARNVGIKASEGEFVALLDSDDEWMPHHLEKRIALFQNNPEADGIYGSAFKSIKGEKVPFISRQIKRNESILEYLLSGSLKACTPSLTLKKEAIVDTLFDDTLKQHQDYDFNIRFHKKYNYLCDEDPSVIIHVDDDKRMGKNVQHDSCLRFIKNYRSEISSDTFQRYLFSQMRQEISKNGKTGYYHKYRNLLLSDKNKLAAIKKIITLELPGLYNMLKRISGKNKKVNSTGKS